MKFISITCDGITVYEEEVKLIEFAFNRDGTPYIEATRVDGTTYALDYDQMVRVTDDNPNLQQIDRKISEEEQRELGIEFKDDENDEEFEDELSEEEIKELLGRMFKGKEEELHICIVKGRPKECEDTCCCECQGKEECEWKCLLTPHECGHAVRK